MTRKLQRTPAAEWRGLTEAEQHQRIRDGHVPYADLDPETKAIVDEMLEARP